MHPAVYIDWGPIEFVTSAYRIALIAAALIAVGGTVLVGARSGLKLRLMLAIAAIGGMGALAGARILGAANTGTSLLAVSFGAFSIWGAIAGGLAAILVVVKYAGCQRQLGTILDAAVVPVGLAIAVSRTGCLCAGCCFGMPTHAPWGITYPRGSSAHIANLESTGALGDLFAGPVPVHPVPIYDGGAALLAAAVAVVINRRLVQPGFAPPGSMAMGFVAVYGIARVVIEAYRFHPVDPGLLSAVGWQVLFASVAVAALTALWHGVRSRSSQIVVERAT